MHLSTQNYYVAETVGQLGRQLLPYSGAEVCVDLLIDLQSIIAPEEVNLRGL